MVTFYSALSGESQLENDRPTLHLNAADVEKALSTVSLQQGGYVVFAPGAEYGEAKRWPARRFSELAAQLDLPVVLLGSGKEAALCQEIAASVNIGSVQKVINLAGKTTLAEALCVIAGSQSAVTNDSGLMHVAAAFSVSQVAIFGSSSPLHTPPLNERAKVLWLKNEALYQPPLDCAPCFERECPLGHLRCLNDVSAESVFKALKA